MWFVSSLNRNEEKNEEEEKTAGQFDDASEDEDLCALMVPHGYNNAKEGQFDDANDDEDLFALAFSQGKEKETDEKKKLPPLPRHWPWPRESTPTSTFVNTVRKPSIGIPAKHATKTCPFAKEQQCRPLLQDNNDNNNINNKQEVYSFVAQRKRNYELMLKGLRYRQEEEKGYESSSSENSCSSCEDADGVERMTYKDKDDYGIDERLRIAATETNWTGTKAGWPKKRKTLSGATTMDTQQAFSHYSNLEHDEPRRCNDNDSRYDLSGNNFEHTGTTSGTDCFDAHNNEEVDDNNNNRAVETKNRNAGTMMDTDESAQMEGSVSTSPELEKPTQQNKHVALAEREKSIDPSRTTGCHGSPRSSGNGSAMGNGGSAEASLECITPQGTNGNRKGDGLMASNEATPGAGQMPASEAEEPPPTQKQAKVQSSKESAMITASFLSTKAPEAAPIPLIPSPSGSEAAQLTPNPSGTSHQLVSDPKEAAPPSNNSKGAGVPGNKPLTWDERFRLLQAYKEREGHANPPRSKKASQADFQLAVWLQCQRYRFQWGTLVNQKVGKLFNLGCRGFEERQNVGANTPPKESAINAASPSTTSHGTTTQNDFTHTNSTSYCSAKGSTSTR